MVPTLLTELSGAALSCWTSACLIPPAAPTWLSEPSIVLPGLQNTQGSRATSAYKAILFRTQQSVHKLVSTSRYDSRLAQLVKLYRMPSGEDWVEPWSETVQGVVASLSDLRRF
jgi:hypothetical protein